MERQPAPQRLFYRGGQNAPAGRWQLLLDLRIQRWEPRGKQHQHEDRSSSDRNRHHRHRDRSDQQPHLRSAGALGQRSRRGALVAIDDGHRRRACSPAGDHARVGQRIADGELGGARGERLGHHRLRRALLLRQRHHLDPGRERHLHRHRRHRYRPHQRHHPPGAGTSRERQRRRALVALGLGQTGQARSSGRTAPCAGRHAAHRELVRSRRQRLGDHRLRRALLLRQRRHLDGVERIQHQRNPQSDDYGPDQRHRLPSAGPGHQRSGRQRVVCLCDLESRSAVGSDRADAGLEQFSVKRSDSGELERSRGERLGDHRLRRALLLQQRPHLGGMERRQHQHRDHRHHHRADRYDLLGVGTGHERGGRQCLVGIGHGGCPARTCPRAGLGQRSVGSELDRSDGHPGDHRLRHALLLRWWHHLDGNAG